MPKQLIHLHGNGPFTRAGIAKGLSLRIWRDPACSAAQYHLRLDTWKTAKQIAKHFRLLPFSWPAAILLSLVGHQIRLSHQTSELSDPF